MFNGLDKEMISIILNCYDVNKSQRHSSMQCISDIRRFTDGDYEIIIVDNIQNHRFRDDYGTLHPYTMIENKINRSVYYSYNQGAKLAKGDRLFFIQNDVFVHDRTINKLNIYLDKWDIAFPQQTPTTREDTLKIMNTPDGEETHIGQRDAGLIGMTREAFDKTGGWDERFHNMLGEAAFYSRIANNGLSWTDHTNAFISHIMAGNNLQKNEGLYNEEMAHDSQLLKEYL